MPHNAYSFSWALFFKEKYIIVNIDTPNIENVLDLMHVILIQKVDWFRKFLNPQADRPFILFHDHMIF